MNHILSAIRRLEEIRDETRDPKNKQALQIAIRELQRNAGYVRPWNEDVRDFQAKFGHFLASQPTLPDRDVMALRQRLIEEEFKELWEALDRRNLPEIARECVDLVYVVLGTMESCGLEFAPFWDAIHEANMRKIPNPERNGKTLKPPGWVKPDLDAMIKAKGEVVDLDWLD